MYVFVLCVISTAAAKSKSKSVFLKHESASAVCVFGNSQRAETSTRSEWRCRTVQALFQDFVGPALALALVLALVLVLAPAPAPAPAQSLVLSDTSHRPALPLWAEQSPCGSWDTGRGTRSCHTPAGWCSPAGRSLRGNLRVIEEPGWVVEVPAGSAPPW